MDEQQFPVCPYCEAEMRGIKWLHEELANIRVFICSECRKILSIQEWYGPAPTTIAVQTGRTQTKVM